MIKFCRVHATLVLAFLFFALGVESKPAPRHPFLRALQMEPNSLKVDLRLEHTVYSLSDSLVVEAAIQNDGDHVIYICRDLVWGPGGFMIHLKDARGNSVQPQVLDDTFGPPPSTDDPALFVRLEQGSFFGTRRTIPVKNLVRRPGKYTLSVEYRSPIPRNYMDEKIRKLPVFWSEYPPILSVPIDVIIRN
jgi:hypothetical protein